MKTIVFALFLGLLMVGCSGEVENEAKEEAIDLDDNQTRNRILAEAIDSKTLDLPFPNPFYRPREFLESRRRWLVRATQKPYTGWMKHMYPNGQVKALIQLKDGRKDGQFVEWDESGQKRSEINWKDGKWDGLWTMWYENGQKEEEGIRNGAKRDGLWTSWHENGQKGGGRKLQGRQAGRALYYLARERAEEGRKHLEGRRESRAFD